MSAVQYFLGAGESEPFNVVLDRLASQSAWQRFDTRSVEFVGRFSRRLLTHPQIRQFPELAALGHWFRPSRLRDLAALYPNEDQNSLAMGRGLAFHLAPSNVDSVFMYSWLISLLAGNVNLVRVSQKLSPQFRFLVDVLRATLEDAAGRAVAGRVLLVTYAHDDVLTKNISEQCMARVVWGGDATVAAIRALPLRPTAIEICFPDRFSAAAFKATNILECTDKALTQIVSAFYNDVFWFAQQACSSPRMVNWVGDPANCSAASDRFWRFMQAEVAQRAPENTEAMSMARLGAAFELAAEALAHPTDGLAFAKLPARLSLEAGLTRAVRELHCGNGLFLEQSARSLEDLAIQFTDKEQTLVVHGFDRDELVRFVMALPARAVDRLVPVGDALGFSPIWDGVDLFVAFSRRISLPATRKEGT